MAEESNGNGGLYFIVGALCVAVAVGAFFLFGGNIGGPSTAQAPASAPAAAPSTTTKNVTIEKIETPKVIERVERIERK